MAQTPKPQNPQINRAHPLARGLVGAWAFTEGGGSTLRDVSGHGLDGALAGTPEWVRTRDGGGMDFDGTGSDVVTIPDNSLLDITDAITLECWLKPETLANTGGFAHKELAYMLYIATGSNLPQFYVYTPSVATATAPSIPPVGEWGHMVGTYDGTTISLYINGVLVDTTANTGSIATNSNDLVIGHYYYLPSTYNYNGVIGSLRVWDRSLKATEILDLYVSPWALYTRPLFGMPNALYTIGGGSSATVGADATAGFPDLLALTSGLLSVPPLAATAGYKSVMSLCGVYIDSAGLPLPSGGGGGKGVRRRRIPMVLFDDAEDGIVINAALDSFGAI